jgi:hypothetical protein
MVILSGAKDLLFVRPESPSCASKPQILRLRSATEALLRSG